MDLVRAIALDLEEQLKTESGAYALAGHDPLVIYQHLQLMLDNGLIEAKDWSTWSSKAFGMVRLTWAGSDFLDSVRDPEIWRKTKDGVKAAGGFSLELIKALATGLIKKKIEQHTGVKLDL